MAVAGWLLLMLGAAECYNVLIYSTSIGHSHIKFHNKLADALADEGHEVVILLSEQNPNFKVGDTKAEVITVPVSEETRSIQARGEKLTIAGFWTSDITDLSATVPMFQEITDMATSQCKKTLDYPGLFDRLAENEFDVGLSEAWDLCGFGLFNRLNITKYAITTTNYLDEGLAAIVGVPNAPSWVPGVQMGYTDEMSIMERVQNLKNLDLSNQVYDIITGEMQALFNSKYGDFPDFKEILANASLVFTNVDSYIDFPKPTIQKVVEIGGITVANKGSANLTAEWERVLAKKPRTILVSFGTIAKAYAMPDEFKNALLGAFDEFPDITFVMKYEKPDDGFAAGHQNVHLSQWMPQFELLGDDRVVAMITHCGAGSMHETMNRGVPVVAVPLFHDQVRNAKVIERVGTGVQLDKAKLSDKDALVEALKKILDSKKYQKRAEQIAKLLEDKPFPAKELFVRSVEFMAEHGPLDQLRPHSRRMNLLAYLNADLILLALGALAFLLVGVSLCLCIICYIIQQRRTVYRRCNDDDFFLHS